MDTCDLVRATLSAHADNEEGELTRAVCDEHVGSCNDCRSFASALPGLVRGQRIQEAVEVPDLTAPILQAIAVQTQEGAGIRRQQLRAVLGVIGLVQALVAIASLVVDGGHLSRELATWQLALGAGFMVAAWQPHRAAGLLPMVGVLGVAAMVSAVGDLFAGATTVTAEMAHLVEVAGVGLVWGVARLADDDAAATSATPVSH